MSIKKNEVNLTALQLIEDLNNGYTWLKKDDLGYGSIEEKYGPNPNQIAAIRKHPDLKDVDTTVTIFNIIGLNKSNDNTTQEYSSNRTNNPVEQPVVSLVSETSTVESNAADIFASL
jgi:hypothetical protein